MHDSNSFQSLVTLLGNLLEAHTTAFFIYDEKNAELQLMASQSTSRFLRERIVLPLDKSGILSQVHKMGQPVHLGKVALEDIHATLPFYREGESGIKGLFAAPVGKTKGLLYVDSKRSWGFNDKQQKWMVEMTDVIHSLMEMEISLLQWDDYQRILDLWHHLSEASSEGQDAAPPAQATVTRCTAYLGAEFGLLAAREKGQGHYSLMAATANVPTAFRQQCFMLESGLVGWAFRNRKDLLIQKMNPDSNEHFVLAPTERMPHSGSFWAVHETTDGTADLVLAFVARREVQWDRDDRHAVEKALQFFKMGYERLHWRDLCRKLEECDPVTGLCNALTFEALVAEHLATSLQSSRPLTLVLVQFEPWQMCYNKVALNECRSWQAAIAEELRKTLPEGTVAARIDENRYALLFLGKAEAEVERCCAQVSIFKTPFRKAVRRGIKLKPYMGWASFPQHGAQVERLWAVAYASLWKDFRRSRQ